MNPFKGAADCFGNLFKKLPQNGSGVKIQTTSVLSYNKISMTYNNNIPPDSASTVPRDSDLDTLTNSIAGTCQYTSSTTSTTNDLEQEPEALQWVPATPKDAESLKERFVVAGHDWYDGSTICVIRATVAGDVIPGKLLVEHRAAYVSSGGTELVVNDIEVLCAPKLSVKWVRARDGKVPPNAIEAGRTASGETLYCARACHRNRMIPGKLQPSHKKMYLTFAGNEIGHKFYEVLCLVKSQEKAL